MRAGRTITSAVVAGAALATGVGVVTTGTAAATVTADPSVAVPVAGTFSYHSGQDAQLPLVHGVVHAVRRLTGATVIYYSLGFAADSQPAWSGVFPLPGLKDDYGPNEAGSVAVVDPAGLKYYQPMVAGGDCLCSTDYEFEAAAGVLTAGFAVLPELPADVTTVSVNFGYGTQVEDVPVGTGPLTPVSTGVRSTAVLGTGWPALPDEATIASVADPQRYVRSLVRSIADTDRTVTTRERPGEVEVDLAADVLFAVDRSALSPAASTKLAQVAADITHRGSGVVSITGFTDSTGDTAHNQTLSQARAQSVVAGLKPAVGTTGVTFTAAGKGESEPVADNGTPEGRRLNRRVTISYPVGAAR